MTTIYNRLSTREEEGQYKHMMGLRSHMVDPGNVHEIAERANMAFGVGSVPVWVPTTTTGLSNSSTAEWPTTDPRGEFFMPTNSKGQPESTVHFRQDTGEILAFHRGTYKLRPEGYGKIFEHAHSLFGETCVAVIGLDNGCRMYALFQPDEPVDFGSGVLIPTVGFAASLDSSIATSVHAFAYDPWCTNAFTGYSTVTNTKATVNHDAIFAERFEVLASTVNRTRALANVANSCASDWPAVANAHAVLARSCMFSRFLTRSKSSATAWSLLSPELLVLETSLEPSKSAGSRPLQSFETNCDFFSLSAHGSPLVSGSLGKSGGGVMSGGLKAARL